MAEVVRVIQGKDDHLIAPELIEANTQDAAPWTVCAPDTAVGAYPTWKVHANIRSDVGFSIDPIPDSRCVSVTSKRLAGYQAPAPRFRRCDNPWSWLNQQAAGEAGIPDLDVQKLIKAQVPSVYWPAIDRTPESVCQDPLLGKSIVDLDNKVEVDDSQPFAFYGVIQVGATDKAVPGSTTTSTVAPSSTTTTGSSSTTTTSGPAPSTTSTSPTSTTATQPASGVQPAATTVEVSPAIPVQGASTFVG